MYIYIYIYIYTHIHVITYNIIVLQYVMLSMLYYIHLHYEHSINTPSWEILQGKGGGGAGIRKERGEISAQSLKLTNNND